MLLDQSTASELKMRSLKSWRKQAAREKRKIMVYALKDVSFYSHAGKPLFKLVENDTLTDFLEKKECQSVFIRKLIDERGVIL